MEIKFIMINGVLTSFFNKFKNKIMKISTNFSKTEVFGEGIGKIKSLSFLFFFLLAMVPGAYAQNSCAVSGVGPAVGGVFPIPVISTCHDNASLTYQSNPLDISSTFLWSISTALGFENTSGAFIIGSTTGKTVSVNSGPNLGSFFLVCIASGDSGSQACGLSVAVFKPAVTADPKEVCIGSTVSLTGSPEGGVWSGDHVSGSTFDATGLTAGQYTVTYTFTDIHSCSNSANAFVTVDPPAAVNANTDQTICAGSTVTISGSVNGGASSGTWSSSGTGTFAPNATTLNAVYTPSAADVTAGTVSLTLTTNDPAGPCPAVHDFMVVTINPPAVVNANTDQTICAGSTVTLSGSVNGGASSGTWSSSGTGTFAPNATTLNAVYTPSAVDVTAGTVNLTLTTNDPAGPCPAVHDFMVVTINPPAAVNANTDQTICAGSTVTLAGSVNGGASSGTWSSSGTGTFAPNATTLNAVYTPSAADVTAGTVSLTLTTNDPAGPCPAVHDFMVVTIQQCGIEGCTLGYWKNHTDRWCPNYTTCDMFGVVFSGAQSTFPNLTLLQALNLGGGGIYNLARQGVAALLNACSDEVDYPAPYLNNPQSIIDAVNAAFLAGGNAPGLLASRLDILNNSGCPLGGTKATTMSNCINKTSSVVGFETYPVPFKDQLTIRYKFDYTSDVKIEIYNSNGILILSKLDVNGYLNKEITMNLNFNSVHQQVYVVKVTTSRESITKKVMSSK